MADQSVDVVYFDPMWRKPARAAASFEGLRSLARHEPLSTEALAQARTAQTRLDQTRPDSTAPTRPDQTHAPTTARAALDGFHSRRCAAPPLQCVLAVCVYLRACAMSW